MAACAHKTYHRVEPDQPYTCMACGAPEEDETESRRYEYKTESYYIGGVRLDGKPSESFEQWLNALGAEGWHLSSMVERPGGSFTHPSLFCVFARRT